VIYLKSWEIQLNKIETIKDKLKKAKESVKVYENELAEFTGDIIPRPRIIKTYEKGLIFDEHQILYIRDNFYMEVKYMNFPDPNNDVNINLKMKKIDVNHVYSETNIVYDPEHERAGITDGKLVYWITRCLDEDGINLGSSITPRGIKSLRGCYKLMKEEV